MLATLGAAIVAPEERLFPVIAQKLLATSEGFEGVDSLFLPNGIALFAPVRLLWNLVRTVATAIVPQSARYALGMPFRAAARLGRSSTRALVRAAEALNLDGVVLRIVKWTRPLWYPFAAIGGFVYAWLVTRNYRQLAWGLPVVLMLVPLGAIAAWTMLWGRGSIAAQYRLAANEARQAKDYERVRLFERKLAQLGVATQLAQYQTAVALAQDGKHAEAYEAMKRLAPEEAPGYLQAHVWMVDRLFESKLPVSTEESHQLVKIHLGHVRTLGARGPQLDLLQAQWLIRDNQFAEAAALLEPLASRVADAAAMRLEVNLRLKNIDAARRDARLVRTYMEDHVHRGGALSAQQYHLWAIAEELLGNLSKAHELVSKWVKLEPQNESARSVLAQLSRRLFDMAIVAAEPDADHLASLFVQAAEMTADPLRLQQQAERLYRLQSESPVARQVIERVADSDSASARTLEAIGTMAAQHGELDEARELLRRAISKDPQNAVAWNNYAWITVQLPDGDPHESLDAVNKALTIKPDDYRFRETRGQILVRLGKWQEAVTDLEFAVNGMPDSREIHLSLAKAYDALGDEQLANVHREHAN